MRSGGLDDLTRLTAAPDGVRLVVDTYYNRVVAVDAEGSIMHGLGMKGHKPSRFVLGLTMSP